LFRENTDIPTTGVFDGNRELLVYCWAFSQKAT
jgi:hypothetical protein